MLTARRQYCLSTVISVTHQFQREYRDRPRVVFSAKLRQIFAFPQTAKMEEQPNTEETHQSLVTRSIAQSSNTSSTKSSAALRARAKAEAARMQASFAKKEAEMIKSENAHPKERKGCSYGHRRRSSVCGCRKSRDRLSS
ncbi:hypothetical protein PAMA_001913 [Pampus argenteus]